MKMKKWIEQIRSTVCFMLAVAVAVFLCGCINNGPSEETLGKTETTQETADNIIKPSETTEATMPIETPTETTGQVTEPTETETQAKEPTQSTTVPTKPLHSEFYLPEYTPQQMFSYFAEVVLSIEYSTGDGDATLVQKWTGPIYYRIYGIPTDEDIAMVNALANQLNGIYGFPGMYAAGDGIQENLSISFLQQSDFDASFSNVINGEYAFGAVEFWYYTATNEIHTARIGCRSDLDQTTRNSVILEEIVNALGLNDTVLRQDSIVYQYSNENTSLSDVDMVILHLLFHPDIRCGMDYESCRAVIEELYY